MCFKRMFLMIGLVLGAQTVFGQSSENDGFDRVPRQALVELKATIGRPFKSGVVFVNGKYIAPPYKVERYGTAFRINGVQVSGQVIHWDDFLRTQSGVKIERVAASAGVSEEVVEEVVEEEDGENADGDYLDDLFSDTPAPSKTKKTVKRVRKNVVKTAEPTVSITLDGKFEMNDRAKALLVRLNKIRTDIEQTLRGGGCIFFSSRHSRITVDPGAADLMLDILPSVMKNNSEYDDFVSAARVGNLGYLPEIALRDIFRNRIDYLRLQERRREIKEERRWENLLR